MFSSHLALLSLNQALSHSTLLGRISMNFQEISGLSELKNNS